MAAALLARVMWEFLGFSATRAATGAASRPTEILAPLFALLAAGAVGLWSSRVVEGSAVAGEDAASRRNQRVTWILDGLLIGGATAVVVWWLWQAPALAQTAKARGAASPLNGLGFASFTLNMAAFSLAALALLHGRTSTSGRRVDGPLALATLGTALFVLADARWMGQPRVAATAFDAILRFGAPVLLGLAALGEARREMQVAAIGSTSDNAGQALAAPLLPIDINNSRHYLAMGLPALAVLFMTWRLTNPAIRSGLFAQAPSMLWWAPLLLLLLVVRYAVSMRATGANLSDASQLRYQVQELRRTVDQRTLQLSTLHSATAELSNSLNSEQILMTAIERTMAALGAQAGAIWISLDLQELSENEDGRKSIIAGESASRTISNATFVWRELERSSTERQALDSLRAKPLTQPGRTSGGAASGVQDKRWSLALARGHEQSVGRSGIAQLHAALEEDGLSRFEALARFDINAAQDTQLRDFEDRFPNAHAAAIRSKGELLGALGVVRENGALETAERALVAALALEVGAALQNVQLYQEASRLADRDSLTDLLNHRAIQQQLNQVLSRSQRSETELAVIMMDLNNFKFFNDTYGHPEGDRVLRIVAQCLREACRGSDIIGRFGGDEFIALLIDTDTQGALHVCRRIAARVEEEGYQQRGDERRIPINLSFGAAVYPHDGTTTMELLTVADANLYEAKRGGAPMMIKRNAVEETQELRKLKDAGTGGSFGVLDALVTAIDNKDQYTRRHSEDVTHWATLIARELEFSTETQRAVRIAGLLHDVGKIAVPDSILRKPGRLNDDEFQIMQQHPVFGALIVKDVPNLTDVLGGIRHHHERFDGKGYPDKLAGENIPLLGRILAVPDCFSAMTTDRPYRKALTWSEALDEIEKGKGTQFDPAMADAFLEVMARLIMEQNAVELSGDGTRESVAQLSTGDGQDASASQVARKMADPDNVIMTPEEDASLRPRSVADAETVG
jgi:diguanylate cyclase (GGDEF)-like protein